MAISIPGLCIWELISVLNYIQVQVKLLGGKRVPFLTNKLLDIGSVQRRVHSLIQGALEPFPILVSVSIQASIKSVSLAKF